jgi:hypothetical protein
MKGPPDRNYRLQVGFFVNHFYFCNKNSNKTLALKYCFNNLNLLK